jgi:hypothetical protein
VFHSQEAADEWLASERFGEPGTYTVEQTDITAAFAHEQAVMSRREEREFCLSILDEIAAYNKEMDIEPSVLFANPSFQAIAMALLTGAPKTARAVIAAAGPSVYPQSKVDEIVAMITAKVGE